MSFQKILIISLCSLYKLCMIFFLHSLQTYLSLMLKPAGVSTVVLCVMWDRIVGAFESCVSLCIFKWKYSWLDWYWQNLKLSFIFLVGCWGFTSAIYINGAFHQLLWFTFSGLAGAFMRRIEIANSLLKSFVPLLSTLYTIVARHWNLVIKNLKKKVLKVDFEEGLFPKIKRDTHIGSCLQNSPFLFREDEILTLV